MPKRKNDFEPPGRLNYDPSKKKRSDEPPRLNFKPTPRSVEGATPSTAGASARSPSSTHTEASSSRLNYQPENVVRRPIKSRKLTLKEFVCEDCNFGFTKRYNLARHRYNKHTPATCEECGVYYQSLSEHDCEKAAPTKWTCPKCDYASDRRANQIRHFALVHSAAARASITRRKEYLARKRRMQYRRKIEVMEKKAAEEVQRSALKEAEKVSKRYNRDLLKNKSRRATTFHKCWICKEKLEGKVELEEHLDIEHHPLTSRLEPGQRAEDMYGERRVAFRGTIAEYVRKYEPGELIDLHHLFREDNAADIIAYSLAKHKSIKFGCHLTMRMQVSDGTDSINLEDFEFRLPYKAMYLEEDLYRAASDVLNDCREELKVRLDQFEEGKGSGWKLAHVVSSSLRINKLPHLYEGRHGVSYVRDFIDQYIKETFFRPSNIENVPANEGECFYYAVAQYFVGRKHLNNQGKAKSKTKTTQKELDSFIEKNIKKNIGTPARFDRVCRFEEANSHLDFKINVFLHEAPKAENAREEGYEEPIGARETKKNNRIVPLRPSKCKTQKTHTINLLLLHVESLSHYTLIRDLGKSVCRTYVNPEGKRTFSHHEPCPRCFTVLSGKRALERHMAKCGTNNTQVLELEPVGAQIEFKSEMKKYRIPLFAVADFEARILSPGVGDVRDTQKRVAIEKQVPVSYSFAVFNHQGDIIFKKTESSQEKCMRLFFATLQEAQVVIFEELKKNVPHGLKKEEVIRLKKIARKCVLCKEKFNSYKRDRHVLTKMRKEGTLDGKELADYDLARVVGKCYTITHIFKNYTFLLYLDHCHISGDYIGITHNACNRKRCSRARDIPVFLHNFSVSHVTHVTL